MKSKFGKIAALGAAMLVTVPTAVALSACGSKETEHKAESAWQTNADSHWHRCATDVNDSHQYNLGEHNWKIYNDDYTCTVCDYTKTVKGTADQNFRVLQSALQDLVEYRGSMTGNVVQGKNFMGSSAGEMNFSFDPVKGVGYYVVKAEDGQWLTATKIFQDSDRYIEYNYEYEKYSNGVIDQVYENSEYALVDQAYLNEMVYGNIDDAEIKNNEAYKLLFSKDLDSATFAALVYELFKPAFGTGEDTAIEIDDYQINYTVQDDVLSVTVSAHGKPTDIEIENSEFTGEIVLTIVDGTVVGATMQAKMTAKVNFQQIELFSANGALNFTFDQTAFNKCSVGELPAKIDVKTIEVGVECECDEIDLSNLGMASLIGGRDYAGEIAVPYATTITADNIEEYTAQLKDLIVENINDYFRWQPHEGAAYQIDASQVEVMWTNDDFETPFNGSLTVKNNRSCLYAKITLNIDIPAAE